MALQPRLQVFEVGNKFARAVEIGAIRRQFGKPLEHRPGVLVVTERIKWQFSESCGRTDSLPEQLGNPFTGHLITGDLHRRRIRLPPREQRRGGFADVAHRDHLQPQIAGHRKPNRPLVTVAADHVRQVLHEQGGPHDIQRNHARGGAIASSR